MSSVANLTSAPSALPSLNLHAHAHKRGVHAQTIDDTGVGTAAQASTGAQSLFGRLLQSIEKVIGVKLNTSASAAPRAGLSGSNINIKV
jgi:hypothetical protein